MSRRNVKNLKISNEAKNLQGYSLYNGLFHGGGVHLLGVQLLASLCCIVYAMVTTAIIIYLLSFCIRFRSVTWK